MRIYIADFNINNLNIDTIMKSFKNNKNIIMKETIEKRIYSDNGIIEIDKTGNLWSMEITDDNQSHIYMMDNVIKLHLDNSSIKRKNKVFQIIPEHTYVIKNKRLFNSHNSTITFIIELNEQKITDIYFETEEDIENQYIKDNIVTFLSLLNFIEYI